MAWLTATLLATLCYGLLQGLQKIAVGRGLSPALLLLASATTVSLFASVGALVADARPGLELVPYAVGNGALFGTGSLLLLRALGASPAAVVLPVHKLDALLVIGIGALVFGERPTLLQWAGAGMGLLVIALLVLPEGRADRGRAPWPGVSLAVGAALCFAGSMTVGKLASTAVPRLPFVAGSYLVTAACAALALLRERSRAAPQARRGWSCGAVLGALNFLGYLLILEAFAGGPLALIQPLFATSMLIGVQLSRRVLGEQVSMRQGLALGCALAALVLIRLG